MYLLAFAPVAGHHILAWIIIGVIAGAVASRVVRGGGLGFFRDMVVGLVGAVIGGLILHAVKHGGSHVAVKFWQETVVAIVGAVILLLIVKAMERTRGRTVRR